MSRRVSLPGAAELFFRSTTTPGLSDASPVEGGADGVEVHGAPAQRGEASGDNGKSADQNGGRLSPRKKHDTKITVYLSQPELLALEHARLALRGDHQLTVDRGRLVREAVAVLLRDFEERGEESVLVRRLRVDEEPAPPSDEPGS